MSHNGVEAANSAQYDPAIDVADRFARLDPHERQRVYDRLARSEQVHKQALSTGKDMATQNQAGFGVSGGLNPIPGELRPDIGLVGYGSQELGLGNIEDAFTYQPWGPSEIEHGNQVREALVFAAKAILRNVPRSPRRTLALQHLITARMDANAAISFGGRF